MLDRLKARKSELARLREERGATDPILIIAGIAITLILLVGGSFAISGFIANANDLNAKGDLDRIATAQAAYLASNDRYGALSVGPNVGTQNTQLQTSSIGFTPTAGNSTIVRTSANGWTAVTKSASGKAYLRSSSSADTFEVPGVNVSSSYGAWTDAKRNLALNPNMVPSGAGAAVQNPVGYNNFVALTAGAGPNGVNAAELRVGSSDNSSGQFRMRFGGMGGTAAAVTPTASVPFSIGLDLWLPASFAGSQVYIEVPVTSTNGTSSFRNAFSFTAREGWQRIERNMTLTPQQSMTDINTVQYPQLVTPAGRFAVGDVIARASNLSFDTTPDAYSFFSGASTSEDPAVGYAWTGPVNNSTSVMRTRPATGTSSWGAGGAPSGLTLPSGITWAQVASDLQDVYS
jgi:hypothetical protein